MAPIPETLIEQLINLMNFLLKNNPPNKIDFDSCEKETRL